MTTRKKTRIYLPIHPQSLSPADDITRHLAPTCHAAVKDVDEGLRIGRP
jgi:hypothetical protein